MNKDNVIAFCRKDRNNVAETLADAAEINFREVVIFGRDADGLLHLHAGSIKDNTWLLGALMQIVGKLSAW